MFLTVVCLFLFFFNKSALFIRSGKFLFGLVKKICLPDRMSGKNLNTFANTDNIKKLKKKIKFITDRPTLIFLAMLVETQH